MASEEAPTVGVCLTGAVRSILTLPVVTTYQQHVVTPLARVDTRVDTHLALVYNARAPANLSARLSAAYTPRSLALIAESATVVEKHWPWKAWMALESSWNGPSSAKPTSPTSGW